MMNTVAFVTNQLTGDRIIAAARQVADLNKSDLVVVGIMDNQYELNPEAVDYLFKQSKQQGASMQLIFREDTIEVMKEVISRYDCRYIVSGMPGSEKSILYDLWKDFPGKSFYTVDTKGSLREVFNKTSAVAR